MNLRKLAIITISSIALCLLPLAGGTFFSNDFMLLSDIAHAKNGNSGGNGGGNGGGNNGGNGNSGGNSGNKGSSSAKSGKSNSASAKSKSATAKKGGFFQNLFKAQPQKRNVDKPQIAARSTTASKKSAVAKPTTSSLIKRVSVDPKRVPVPMMRPSLRERSFNAKLAGLNSLNRNFKAYMNSNDPRMAAMREFIDANIAFEDAESAVLEAAGKLAAANAALTVLTNTLVGYDNFSYQDATPGTLSKRLETLNAIDVTGLTAEEAEQLADEITNLSQIVDSEEFASATSAQTELESAEVTAAALESSSGDDALKTALLAAANVNRLAEYAEENYVDQEMLDWANELLGKGEAVGVIDQIRSTSTLAEANEEVAETAIIAK